MKLRRPKTIRCNICREEREEEPGMLFMVVSWEEVRMTLTQQKRVLRNAKQSGISGALIAVCTACQEGGRLPEPPAWRLAPGGVILDEKSVQ